MLRVVDKWQGSDVGRQREGNEDSYLVQSPLFVLADGMGGAQAGEVASELTIDAFREGLPPGAVEKGLAATILTANARVHEQATTVPEYQGMGTTCTVAYVADEEIVLAHVGDSRAYLLRDDGLTRLTHDHSLVDELIRNGKITEEEALTHPQRSVITRAVGPEPAVKVDIERITGRAGDVILLCSDGLTDMVRDADLERLLADADDLERVGRELIAAANAAGGRDNITVILFRLEQIEAGAATVDGGRTTEQQAVSDDSVAPPPRRTAPLPQAPRPEAPAKPPGRFRRLLKPLLVVAIVLAFFGTGLFIAIRGVFFVGLDANRSVTIFRGVPYEGPFGIDLYTRHYSSGVRIDQVPEARRETFTDHKWRSLDDVEDLVRQLETGDLSQ